MTDAGRSPQQAGSPAAAERPTWRQARVRARSRMRRGGRRLRTESLPILTGALAAGIAYVIAAYGLGHEFPVFAPIAAWVSLGFTHDRRPRKVAELALGVTIGVALGELFSTWFGTGPVQIAVVLALAVSAARLIDAGQMLAMQAGVQAVVVVALPADMFGTATGFGRWTDALIGGSIALLTAVLIPIDVRRKARSLASSAMREIAQTLIGVAHGLRELDRDLIEDALVQARGSQAVIDEWQELVRGSLAATRFSPPWLRHDAEMTRLDRAGMLSDRAMRNTRVLARRARPLVEDPAEGRHLAELLDRVALSCQDLAAAHASNTDPAIVRRALVSVAEELDPREFAGWRAQTEVVLLRSLVVDLLEISGMSGAQARAELADPGSVTE
ncbi:MAG TPA: FUSC family protein [Beutenbergiaceae bacterium]|nr:FUSC family protein [Beutenbergiaceae bacterium]